MYIIFLSLTRPALLKEKRANQPQDFFTFEE